MRAIANFLMKGLGDWFGQERKFVKASSGGRFIMASWCSWLPAKPLKIESILDAFYSLTAISFTLATGAQSMRTSLQYNWIFR